MVKVESSLASGKDKCMDSKYAAKNYKKCCAKNNLKKKGREAVCKNAGKDRKVNSHTRSKKKGCLNIQYATIQYAFCCGGSNRKKKGHRAICDEVAAALKGLKR